MPDNAKQEGASFSYGEAILLIVGFVVVSVVFAAFVGLVNAYNAHIALPMLTIAGIILILLCLAGISYIFVRMGLHDKSQALGLPSGSIQSVIALSLIVLFAILSVFIFTAMGGPTRTLTGLTSLERDAQVDKLGTNFAGWQQNPDGKFTIFVRNPMSDAQNDIGKQLIVLIGTLMTSAVSFYFGTRATVAGAGVTSTAADPSVRAETAPVITEIEPLDGISKGQPTQVTIVGSGLSKATRVEFKQGDEVLEVASLKPTETEVVCTVTPAARSPTGMYDLIMTVAGKEVSKPAGLKVVEQ